MSIFKSLVMLVAIASMAGLSSCQTPGKLVKTEQSPNCPHCKIETRTSLFKNMTYTKMVCPDCKTETVDMEIYEGGGPYETVHVCDHCKSGVTKCEKCSD